MLFLASDRPCSNNPGDSPFHPNRPILSSNAIAHNTIAPPTVIPDFEAMSGLMGEWGGIASTKLLPFKNGTMPTRKEWRSHSF